MTKDLHETRVASGARSTIRPKGRAQAAAGDGVEGVAEINFEKHLVRDAGVPLHPLSGCVDHRFCAMTGGYPNLQGTQKIPGWHPDIIAEAFGC